MSIRLASHLYRNRHGGFYFRFVIPSELRAHVRQREVRLSLYTERRLEAIISAVTIIAELPQLKKELRHMAENDEDVPPDYFKLWRDALFQKTILQAKVSLLRSDVVELNDRLADMVPRKGAKQVGKLMYEKGQLKGRQELEERLVFPWPPERTPRFSELMKAYLTNLRARPVGARRRLPTKKTLDEYEKTIGFFIRVMDDPHIGAVDRTVAAAYFSTVRKLPPNLNRVAKYAGKSIPDILAMGDTPQSESNASKYMERVSAMFKWALEEKRKWGIDANPFTGYGQAGNGETSRRPFTSDELRALLSHPSFKGREFSSAYSYWMIPLALYTGARLGELAQLDLKDFVVIDEVPCIDINDDEASELVVDPDGRKKKVKNRNAKRLVPIHSELIRLGLLRYVEARRVEGKSPHLFPELNRERRDGPGQAVSNWFQRFREKVGIAEKQATVFHSFRHGFITHVLDAGVSEHMLAPVVGHEAQLITGRVYWNKKDATKRQPTVEAFSLPSDIASMIPSLDEVKFSAPTGPKPGPKKSKPV